MNTQSASHTTNATFDTFINSELLPRIGISRLTFNRLLDALIEKESNLLENHSAIAREPSAGAKNQLAHDSAETNIHWGSLFSALYQEDVIPHCAGLRAGSRTNPARIRRVTSSVKDFLDIAFPLTEGSHHDVTSYMVYFQNLMMILADGSTSGLQNPGQFVAKSGPCDKPEAILLLQNGLHVELGFDTCRAAESTDLAGINDVQIEIVKSSCSELSAPTVDAKCERYRNLMLNAFSPTEPLQGNSNELTSKFTAKCGDQYQVGDRGHLVYISSTKNDEPTLVTDNLDQPVATNLVDTLIASLIATTVNRGQSDSYNNPRIIVASDKAALTLRVLNRVEKACKQSLATRPLSNLDPCQRDIKANEKPADIRAELETLAESELTQATHNKHSPVNKNEKATYAAAVSINHAVLSAVQHHGCELARLSMGLPDDTFGDKNQFATRAVA